MTITEIANIIFFTIGITITLVISSYAFKTTYNKIMVINNKITEGEYTERKYVNSLIFLMCVMLVLMLGSLALAVVVFLYGGI